MANKVWYTVEIATEEQNITISPTTDFDGITVDTAELDGNGNPRLYLNKEEMECFIAKMREMMDYVTSK